MEREVGRRFVGGPLVRARTSPTYRSVNTFPPTGTGTVRFLRAAADGPEDLRSPEPESPRIVPDESRLISSLRRNMMYVRSHGPVRVMRTEATGACARGRPCSSSSPDPPGDDRTRRRCGFCYISYCGLPRPRAPSAVRPVAAAERQGGRWLRPPPAGALSYSASLSTSPTARYAKPQ